MTSKTPLTIILPAFGAALIAILAQLTIAIGPVPFSFQNLAVGLVVTLLRPKQAIISVLIYLLLGAIGLPVFAGNGGFQVLMGPTAGYLWGYLLYALTTTFLTSPKTRPIQLFVANLIGDGLVLLSGAVGLMLLANYNWNVAWTVGILPFLLPDSLKMIAISLISATMFKRLKGFDYYKN